jgi:hypothetical protein
MNLWMLQIDNFAGKELDSTMNTVIGSSHSPIKFYASLPPSQPRPLPRLFPPVILKISLYIFFCLATG